METAFGVFSVSGKWEMILQTTWRKIWVISTSAPWKTRSKRAGLGGEVLKKQGLGRLLELLRVEVIVGEEAICRELKIQATFRKYAPRGGSGRVLYAGFSKQVEVMSTLRQK